MNTVFISGKGKKNGLVISGIKIMFPASSYKISKRWWQLKKTHEIRINNLSHNMISFLHDLIETRNNQGRDLHIVVF